VGTPRAHAASSAHGARITYTAARASCPTRPRSISEAELNAVTAELDAWAHKSVAGFDALAESHRGASQALKENIGALAQQQLELNDALGRHSNSAKEAQRLGAQLSAQLEQLHVDAARLPAKRADIEAVIDKEAQSVRAHGARSSAVRCVCAWHAWH
jgi:chromosome segregation ATPase